MGSYEFDAATALSGEGPDFGAVLDGRWDGQDTTNGGFLLALATRAIGAVLPFPDRPPSGNPVYEGWMRFADGREPDLISLPLFVDAVAPAALELGLRRMTTLELTVHLRARPVPGWLAFRTLTRYLAGGYFEEDAELWDSAGFLVAQSRQLALVLG
jgi:hypothetical protein